jgi:hypothetical protein
MKLQDFDSALAHDLAKIVMLVLRFMDPQHIVEEQRAAIFWREPKMRKAGSADEHLTQSANFRICSKRRHRRPPSDVNPMRVSSSLHELGQTFPASQSARQWKARA